MVPLLAVATVAAIMAVDVIVQADIQDIIQDQVHIHVIRDIRVATVAMAVMVDTVIEEHHMDGDHDVGSSAVNGGGGITTTGSDTIHTHGRGAASTQATAATAFTSHLNLF